MEADFDALGVWALARLQERSTVAGIVGAVALLCGSVIDPAKLDALATVVGAMTSIVCIVTKEAPKCPSP